MSIEVKVDVSSPVFEEDRFVFRHVYKIVNDQLKKYGAEWVADKKIIRSEKRYIDDRLIDDIFNDLYYDAWIAVANWKKKLNSIIAILFFVLYSALTVFFIAAYMQTHGVVAIGICAAALALLFIPWWYHYFAEIMLPAVQENFPLKLTK